MRRRQLADADTRFNTWQRIAGWSGIGLVAALYATRARTLGPVAALHSAGLVLVAIAAAGALGALALPAVRNTVPSELAERASATRAGDAARPRARRGRRSHARAS